MVDRKQKQQTGNSEFAKVAVRLSKERFSIFKNSYFKGALSKAVTTFGKPQNVR